GIDFAREGIICGVDVRAALDGLAIAGDGSRQLIAHDRRLIRWGAHDAPFIQWREHLGIDGRLVPSLGAPEILIRLLRIDARNEGATHVFMRVAEGVPGLVAHDPLVFRFRR
ncbi:MAG: hypothetical protein ACK55I_15400, partial [bacterium]